MALTIQKLRKSIIFHLLLMVLIAVVIYLIFFFSLEKITNHGKQYEVPVLIGKNKDVAIKELKKAGFRVDIDSAYDLKKKPSIVLSQMPDTGSIVKKGRTIFITVNKAEAPLTPMPELTGLSYRSGLMVLKSNKLLPGDTTHVPDIADGAILEQKYDGKPITAGQLVPQGSKINLVIGDGLGNIEFEVPNVIGMTYQEGIAVLNASGLQFIDLWDTPITDSATAVIYFQSPTAKTEDGEPNRIQEGGFVDIKIKQGTGHDNFQSDTQPLKKARNKNKGQTVDSDEDSEWGM